MYLPIDNQSGTIIIIVVVVIIIIIHSRMIFRAFWLQEWPNVYFLAETVVHVFLAFSLLLVKDICFHGTD